MESLTALIFATFILVLIPGPNMALIVANSLGNGARAGIATVIGTTVGVAMQLALVVGGLAVIVEVAADALTWVRWVGVIYLIWLGVRTWRTPVSNLSKIEAAPTAMLRGCLLAVVNPKTLLFNAAFIPQFVATGSMAQLALAAAVFLSVLFVGDLAWVAFASSARVLLTRYTQWRNRITGGFLAAAGVGLAMSRRS